MMSISIAFIYKWKTLL